MAVLSLRSDTPSSSHINRSCQLFFHTEHFQDRAWHSPVDWLTVALFVPDCPCYKGSYACQITHVLLADPPCCSQQVHVLEDLDAAESPHP